MFIETDAPHKHAIQQTFFLYVYELGGNRIELCNPVARLVPGPGLAHDHLDGGRTGQGPGVGPEDDRVLPHPRNPARLAELGLRAADQREDGALVVGDDADPAR